MGMAFKSLSVYNANPTYQTLIDEGKMSPIFGFKFATSGSELFLGGVNPALYTGEFTWVDLSVVVREILQCVKCISDAFFLFIGLLAGMLR